MNKLNAVFCAVAFASLLSACQSTSEPRQVASETNVPAQENQNTLEIFEASKASYEDWLAKMDESKSQRIYDDDLVDDLFDAWDEAVDVYEDFASNPEKATKDYSMFSDGTYAETFDKRLTKVAELYEELQTLKATADSLLAEAMVEMAYLNEIGADELYASRYKRLSSDYRKLFAYVADNDIDDAQVKQAVFLENAKKLEIAVVLKTHVAPLKDQITLLRREGFKSVAPISFTKSEASLEQAVAAVNANPRDIESINIELAAVQFEIDHVKHIGQEVKRFRNVDDGKFEPLILELENRLHAIAQAMDGLDLRNQTMQQQALVLEERAQMRSTALTEKPDVDPQLAKLMSELDKVQSDLSVSQQEKESLTAQVTTLEAQNSKNEGLIDDLKMVIDTIKPKEDNSAAKVGAESLGGL
ncbi:hypothetical protein GCE9029_01241 [Grimontia celer]|uniref:Chromosome partition protein Smc n=1 Tax=Grimontia celer TaxID=1796497 RepID=A0A128EY43_9GAMM|nr:hypothetical protein [Grimontia celer]CZF79074.1 hypothetical protein GCE9029_01241 [Grimontia celer]